MRYKIPLIQSTFFDEESTKLSLIEFVTNATKLSMGEQCAAAEAEFAAVQERKYATMLNSGSSANLALIQALTNLGHLKKNDKVAFSSLTWSTNVMPLIQLGLTPVPVDVNVKTLNVSSTEFRKVVERHPEIKCFFISNILGFCDDLENIAEFCKKKNIILIEDNCESLGTKYKGRLLGNYSLASTMSFFVGHHLSAIEGGMVFTDDYELSNMLKMVRAHGWDRNLDEKSQKALRSAYGFDAFYDNYTFYDLGYNLRPTEINGFLLRSQIPYLPAITQRRYENFKCFYEASLCNPDIVHLDVSHIEVISNFAFPVAFKTKELFNYYKELFLKSSVEIRPLVGGNITKQPFYLKYFSQPESMNNSDFLHDNGFYFPNNPEIEADQIEVLVSLLKKPK